jgi:hypothetical protein
MLSKAGFIRYNLTFKCVALCKRRGVLEFFWIKVS